MCDVGHNFYLIKVLLMHVVEYNIHIDAWSKWYACGVFVNLLSMMCEVMGLHMYIALVGLDCDYE